MAALRVTLPFVLVSSKTDNQVNFGDPIGDNMISEYHTILYAYEWYVYMEKILPRRMSTTACSFASYFGQEMAQNADLSSESCKNFSGYVLRTPPNPRPVPDIGLFCFQTPAVLAHTTFG